jgi:hypothetical protein
MGIFATFFARVYAFLLPYIRIFTTLHTHFYYPAYAFLLPWAMSAHFIRQADRRNRHPLSQPTKKPS